MFDRRAASIGLTLFALVAASARLTAAPLVPPGIIMQHLAQLKEIDRVRDLPQALQSFRGWTMADPGARWQSTDVIEPGPPLPGRRLVFGACDQTVCVLRYSLGGIARTEHLLGFTRVQNGYKVAWNVLLYSDVPRTLDDLRNTVSSRKPIRYDLSQNNWY